MADSDKISKTILAYEVDQASISSVQRATQAILADFRRLEGGVQATSTTTKNLTAGLKELQRAGSIQNLTREFVALGKSAKDFDGALINLRRGLKDVGATSAEIDRATEAFRRLQTEAKKSQGGGGSGFSLGSLKGIGKAVSRAGFDEIGAPIEGIGTVSAITGQVSSALQALGLAAGPAAIAVGGVAVATASLAHTLSEGQKAVDAANTSMDLYFKTIQTGTTESIKSSIAQQQAIIDQVQPQIDILEKKQKDIQSIDTGEGANVADVVFSLSEGKHLAELKERAKTAQANIDALNRALDSNSVKVHDAVGKVQDFFKNLTDGAKKVHDSVEQQVKLDYAASQQFNKTFSDQMEERRKAAADTAAKEKAFRDQQVQEAVNATQKYNNAVKETNERAGEQELAAKQKYSERVADAIQKAIDDSTRALDKLNQARQDLQIGAARDEAKAGRKEAEEDIDRQIKFRREERDDLIDHLKKVRDIQRQFRSEERDALLDRNFLQLFKLQENKKDQERAENEAFEDQRRQRQQQVRDEMEDAQRARAFERRERFIALQERLDDALRGYQLEIQQAAKARSVAIQVAAQQRDAEIILAQQKRNATLSILSSQYAEELRLASLTSAERMQIFINELNQARAAGFRYSAAQAISATSPFNSVDTSGRTVQRYAEGGTFGPGTVGMYNDGYPGQRESINGVVMPPGIGMFVSTAAGAVKDTGANIGNLSIPITIHESKNPQATYQIAKQAAVDAINQVMRR